MTDQAQSLQISLVEEIKRQLYSQEFLKRNRQRSQDFTPTRILTFTLLILLALFAQSVLHDVFVGRNPNFCGNRELEFGTRYYCFR